MDPNPDPDVQLQFVPLSSKAGRVASEYGTVAVRPRDYRVLQLTTQFASKLGSTDRRAHERSVMRRMKGIGITAQYAPLRSTIAPYKLIGGEVLQSIIGPYLPISGSDKVSRIVVKAPGVSVR